VNEIQGGIQDFKKRGVFSRCKSLWGVRERGILEDFKNMDCEIRHFSFSNKKRNDVQVSVNCKKEATPYSKLES